LGTHVIAYFHSSLVHVIYSRVSGQYYQAIHFNDLITFSVMLGSNASHVQVVVIRYSNTCFKNSLTNSTNINRHCQQ